jgi:exosortase
VVPLISLFFIRLKWEHLRRLTPAGSMWGLAIAAVGVVGQIFFRATGLEHMSGLSIVVVLDGLVLFVFGWQYMKMLWLPIGYLVFALPPPRALYVQVTMPMQAVAAELGVQLLPLFGGEGVRQGTVIDVGFGGQHTQLFVAQACSGMRMLVAFFALAVALGYSTERPVWQKVTLAACALPIAILCNGLRVTLTGFLAVKVSEDWAKGDAHGFFGLAMLVPAMLMQLGVAWTLDRIFVEERPAEGGAT